MEQSLKFFCIFSLILTGQVFSKTYWLIETDDGGGNKNKHKLFTDCINGGSCEDILEDDRFVDVSEEVFDEHRLITGGGKHHKLDYLEDAGPDSR